MYPRPGRNEHRSNAYLWVFSPCCVGVWFLLYGLILREVMRQCGKSAWWHHTLIIKHGFAWSKDLYCSTESFWLAIPARIYVHFAQFNCRFGTSLLYACLPILMSYLPRSFQGYATEYFQHMHGTVHHTSTAHSTLNNRIAPWRILQSSSLSPGFLVPQNLSSWKEFSHKGTCRDTREDIGRNL